MKDLIPALKAEMVKSKRTLALWLAFIAPFVIAFLNLLIYIQRASSLVEEGANPWYSLAQNDFVLWALLMLPLFATLETALLNGLEHNQKNWKLLFSMPISRGSIYAAKQIVSLALIGLSTLVLCGLILLSGLFLKAIIPAYGFDAAIPWKEILTVAFFSYLASWLIISVHLWVSAWWSSFVVAMGVGVVATIAAVLMINSDWANYYPWTMPGLVTTTLRGGQAIGIQPIIGLAGGLLVALIGGIAFTRRDVL